MRKHIYVHSSNLEYRRELRHADEFEGVPEYAAWEMPFTSQNEYGRIKTDAFYIHLLMGQMQQEGCPWCGSPPTFTKLSSSDGIRLSTYCMQCNHCGARGTVLNVNPHMEQKKETMDEVESILKHRFTQRIPWDKDFVNHYETAEKETK